MRYTILQGDCIEVLHTLPAQSVHCVVTSPPYYLLCDYQVDGQIGLEPTVGEYVDKLVQVFRGLWRVLRDDATAWLNLGDSFCDKQLVGIPWRVAFALQTDGWRLRSDVIWAKPNPMPESVTDRPTKAHEYLFLLAKAERYFYDAEAIAESVVWSELSASNTHTAVGQGGKHGKTSIFNQRWQDQTGTRNKRSVWNVATEPYSEAHFATMPTKLAEPCVLAGTSAHGACAECGAPWFRVVEKEAWNEREERRGNARGNAHIGQQQRIHNTNGQSSGVTRTTTGWQPSCTCGAPVVPCTVLDPFCGSGTTGVVATRTGRNFIGVELNPAYIELARRRIGETQPALFAADTALAAATQAQAGLFEAVSA